MDNENQPVVAAFDLDGTLTEGGSVFPWLKSIAGRGRTWRAAISLALPLAVGAIRSSRWADNAKERLFVKLLAGIDEQTVKEKSRTFAAEHLEHEGRALLLARLDWHRQQGHDVVLVSASPQLYVDVMTEQLGANGGLGTRLAVDPRGRLTGGYLGKNCRGTEKLRRLDVWIAQRHYPTPPVVFAYGNSRGDRRLLSGATHPFNVGRLGVFGSLRRFPRLRSADQ
ncbi:MAG TPA: HAD-IB family hydrolase [Acidimicrobiales bacterium]|nr:HAD-IB family hydrolase [Acidimicrobiales bacterium]